MIDAVKGGMIRLKLFVFGEAGFGFGHNIKTVIPLSCKNGEEEKMYIDKYWDNYILEYSGT